MCVYMSCSCIAKMSVIAGLVFLIVEDIVVTIDLYMAFILRLLMRVVDTHNSYMYIVVITCNCIFFYPKILFHCQRV